MIITVKVKLRSKLSKIEKIEDLFAGENQYKVWVKSPPVDGRANEEVIQILSDYFHHRKDLIKIIKGQSSTLKVIELSDYFLKFAL